MMGAKSQRLITPDSLFQSNGYINAAGIFDDPAAFCLLTGGRGTGKTYNILWELIRREIKFVLLRRTQTQIDELSKPDMNPFKSLNRDQGLGIVTAAISKKVSGFYRSQIVDGEEKPFGPPIGYAIALTAIAKLRGVDLSDIDCIFFDEFIKEPSELSIRNEPEAILNAYETIARNRELSGRDPVKFIGASNSNQLDNPLFLYLELVTTVEQMRAKGQPIRRKPDRDLLLMDAGSSRISEAKRNTALYRLTRGTAFAGMALDNSYNVDNDRYSSRSIREYKPVCTMGEVTLYKHKSNGTYYCTPHREGSPPKYKFSAADRQLFKLRYKKLPMIYHHNLITFETFYTESVFLAYLS